MEEKKYLSLGQKLAYGAGNLGNQVTLTILGSFVLIYLTDSVGLNSGIIGTLMLLSKILDGVTDLFFGSMIDRTHSKMGKARPWMFWSIFPLVVCEILMFSMPSMGETLQYVYFFVVYTALNAIFLTAQSISYSTLSALATKNENERVQLGVISFVISFIAVIVINSATLQFVSAFGGGVTGWRITAIIYAVVSIVGVVITSLFVKEIPEGSSEIVDPNKGNKADAAKGQLSLLETFKYLLKNKYFLLMVGALIGFTVIATAYNSMSAFYARYVLENENLMGALSLASMVPMIVALFLTPFVAKKFSLYKVNSYGFLIAFVFSILALVCALLRLFIPLMILTVLRGLFAGPFAGTQNAITAQICDYAYLKDKMHIEGAMFSCISFGQKLGSGIATALVGWLLELGGYVGTATVQSGGAITMIIVLFAGLPTVFYGLNALFLWKLNVEQANKELKAAEVEKMVE